MIVGGGQLSYYLAKMLLKSHTEVTIIERDMARCEELVEALPGATIDCGDAPKRSCSGKNTWKAWTASWPAPAWTKSTPSCPCTP